MKYLLLICIIEVSLASYPYAPAVPSSEYGAPPVETKITTETTPLIDVREITEENLNVPELRTAFSTPTSQASVHSYKSPTPTPASTYRAPASQTSQIRPPISMYGVPERKTSGFTASTPKAEKKRTSIVRFPFAKYGVPREDVALNLHKTPEFMPVDSYGAPVATAGNFKPQSSLTSTPVPSPGLLQETYGLPDIQAPVMMYDIPEDVKSDFPRKSMEFELPPVGVPFITYGVPEPRV